MTHDTPRQSLKDQVWLNVAKQIARLSTCPRRQVGAVFLDEKGRVLATGRNGVPAGDPHCIDHPCPGAKLPSGTGLEKCEAIHAEQNAIAQLKDLDKVHTVYCTTAPCIHCVKMICATSAKRIVFATPYPHPESEEYWTRRGGIWEHVPIK